MKVLLIEPGYGYERPDRAWMPVGKMQIASYLRDKGGHEVHIIDDALYDHTDDDILRLVAELNPDFTCIGGMSIQHSRTMHLAEVLRTMPIVQRGLLVGGGVHFTVSPRDGEDLFDLVIKGEGERAILSLCHKGPLDFGTRLKAEDIPTPAYDLVDVKEYGDCLITGEKAPMIMTGRGCPYDCYFCGSPKIWERSVRLRPIIDVMDELTYLNYTYGYEAFRIMDDTFALSLDRVKEFRDAAKELPFKLRYTCLTHVNTITKEMCEVLKDSGCEIVALGIESADDRVLEMINKGTNSEDAMIACEMVRESGMGLECLFMIGNIGETVESVESSISFAKTVNPQQAYPRCINWFQFATPFPGSRFYESYSDHGELLTEDYNRLTHQEPIFVPNGMTAQQMVGLRNRALGGA